MPVDGNDICVGVKSSVGNLKPGELFLSSTGGATIHLKDDGSVCINGIVITKDGKILS